MNGFPTAWADDSFRVKCDQAVETAVVNFQHGHDPDDPDVTGKISPLTVICLRVLTLSWQHCIGRPLYSHVELYLTSALLYVYPPVNIETWLKIRITWFNFCHKTIWLAVFCLIVSEFPPGLKNIYFTFIYFFCETKES